MKKKMTQGAAAALVLTIAGSASACSNSAGTSTSSTSRMSSNQTASQKNTPILLSASDVARLKKSSSKFADIINQCDGAMSYQAKPVTDLAAARHYSSTGANAPDTASKVLEADSQQAYKFALCYVITGQTKYANAAQKIIDAWSTTLKSASTISGKDSLAFFMTPMTPAASWVRGVNGWSGNTYANFLKNVGLPNTKVVIAHEHNHGLWGVWYQASAAIYLGDKGLLTQTEARWQVLMQQETASDGTMTNEVQRSDTSDYTGGPDKGKKGLAYTNYALLPATLAAKTFADAGQPVWNSPGGVLLGKAYAKAAGWIINPKTFPYYASNNGQLEGVDTAAYAAILQHHYPNANGETLLKNHMLTGDGYLLTRLFS